MLNNIKTKTNERGFTIIELLIVIVIIAILAAITLVAYNGITARGKTASEQSTASEVQQKIEAYNADTGGYPNATGALTTAASSTSYQMSSASVTFSTATPSAPSNSNTVWYLPSTTVGGCLYYWSFVNNNANNVITLGSPASACATTAPASTGSNYVAL